LGKFEGFLRSWICQLILYLKFSSGNADHFGDAVCRNFQQEWAIDAAILKRASGCVDFCWNMYWYIFLDYVNLAVRGWLLGGLVAIELSPKFMTP